MSRYALVIGIGPYQNLSSLPQTVIDAEVLAQVLEDYGDYKVIRLPGRRNAETNRFEMVNKKVSAKKLAEELRNLLQECGENSEVLIYFAGHGFTMLDNLGRQQGFLAASDSEIEKNSDKTVISQKNSISLESLNELIQNSKLSSLVMLLDCCQSGFFLESQLVQKTLSAFTSQKDYYLITACRSFETARVFEGEPHSIFTGSLLKGLNPENTGIHRRVTGDRLFDFISGDLKNSAKQEPIRLGWGKSITLVTYPPAENNPEKLPESFAVDRSNPYVGLASFGLEENEYFFGREAAVRDLLEFLKNGRFLAVIGPSGCGKSSLIKAGLLPLLKKNGLPGSKDWPVAIFTPGTQPLENLARAFYSPNISQNSILFIDQFEELFTLCDNEEQRKEFIHRITQEATSTERFTRVILSMRGDFLDRCAEYQEIADLVNKTQPTTYMVTKLTPAELEEAIEKPATKHGVDFEWGLVGEIIGDVVDQAGALPLLQYALAELWRVCVSNSKEAKPQLSRECYKNIGGVGGALEKRADELYHNLDQTDKKLVQKLFLELVQLGEEKEVTRRRASWEDLEIIADSRKQLERVTRQLAGQQQRLIITDENTVEVAHEALLTEWRLLVKWIEENRESLRLGRRLKSECLEWEKNQKSEDWLLADAWLAGIAQWVEKTQPRLSGIEQEFLSNSLEKRDREIQEKLEAAKREAEAEAERAKAAEAMALVQLEKSMEAQARAEAEAREESAKAKAAEATAKFYKQRSRFAVAAGVFISLILGLGIVAKQLQEQKQKGEVFAAGALVEQSQGLLKADNQLQALTTTVKSLHKLKEIGRQNPEDLKKLAEVIYNVREENRLGNQAEVYAVNFSPNGKFLVSGGLDKLIRLWDVNELTKPRILDKHKQSLYTLRFSSNSQQFATTSDDGNVFIWKIDNLKQPIALTEHKQRVTDVSFSGNNEKIATASKDGTIKIWKTKTGEKIAELIYVNSPSDAFPVYGLDFNPTNDSMIVSTGKEGSYDINIWNLRKKEPPISIGNNKGKVLSAKFNKKGNLIVSGDSEGLVKIWNNQGLLMGTINNGSRVMYTEFSPDSQFIAAAGLNGTVKLWSVNEALKIGENNPADSLNDHYLILLGHKAPVTYVSFNESSTELVSGSNDGTIRIWDITPRSTHTYENLKLDELINKSCHFLSGYLKNHPDIEPDVDKICKN